MKNVIKPLGIGLLLLIPLFLFSNSAETNCDTTIVISIIGNSDRIHAIPYKSACIKFDNANNEHVKFSFGPIEDHTYMPNSTDVFLVTQDTLYLKNGHATFGGAKIADLRSFSIQLDNNAPIQNISFQFVGKVKEPTLLTTYESIYYDSKILSDASKTQKWDNLLMKYPKIDTNTIDIFFSSELKNYINQGEQSGNFTKQSGTFSLTNAPSFFKRAASTLGGLDVTKYADGLAKFLVKRTKQELSIAFFEGFQEAIRDEPDLNDLFPQTASTLSLIGTEVYFYQRYLTSLRENFESDLKLLPDNFPKIVDNHPEFFDNHPGLGPLVKNTAELAKSIRDNVHPGQAIANLNTDEIADFDPTMSGALETVQLLSAALRDTVSAEDANYWVPKEQIKELVDDEKAFKIFIGLIREKAKLDSIRFGGGKYLYLLLDQVGKDFNKTKEKYRDYKKFFQNLSNETEELNQLIKNRKKAENQDMSLEEMLRFFDSTVDIVESATYIDTLLPKDVNLPTNGIKKAVSLSRNASHMIVNVSKKKYGAAVMNLVRIYDEAVKKTISERPSVSDAGITKSEADDFVRKLLKYATFMATIVQAESSDDVAAAIESYALPAGSARIKRSSTVNVSLNAYVGPYVGIDNDATVKTQDNGDSIVIKGGGAYGLTVPVGVALSVGLGSKTKAKNSLSLFFSLLDIGAIASFRFKDDATDVPKIFLREIFSPGIYASFSFAKIMSLNAGYQRAPLLRQVGTDVNEVVLYRTGRWSLSFVVDIPLANFYTKSK